MRGRLKYVLILVFCYSSLPAQLLPFKNYTTKDGLLNNEITAVIKDKRGLLWVGTPFGINWFDGHKFTEVPLKVNRGQLYVTGFLRDTHDNIWIYTFYNGLYRFDGQQFTNYLPNKKDLPSNSNSVFGMCQYDDSIYLVCTDQNVFWLKGNEFRLLDATNEALSRQIRHVATVKHKWIFLADAGGLTIYKKEDNGWQLAGRSLEDYDVNAIMVRDNSAWITTNKGLLYFENADQVIQNKVSKVHLPGKWIGNVSMDAEGDLWINTDKLYRYQGGNFIEYGREKGLNVIPGNIYHDDQGIMWIYSYEGLVRLTDENSIFYDLRSGPTHSMITTIQKTPTNEIWFGTFDGLGRFNNGKFQAFRTLNGRPLGYISWLTPHENGLLAGTTLGIVYITSNGLSIRDSIQTTKIFREPNGNYWLGTVNGAIYRMEQNKISRVLPDKHIQDFIDGIEMDNQGNLYIGYRGYGICKYRTSGSALKFMKEYTPATGFPVLDIRSSHKDPKGNLLFGTRTNGLFIIGASDEKKTWHFNSSKGLPTNWVKNISRGALNSLLIATNKGVYQLTGEYDTLHIKKMVFQREELTNAANTVFNDGTKIWVGTESGLVEYLQPIKDNSLQPPSIYLTELSVNGKKDSSLITYTAFLKKRFGSDENVIAFEFAGVALHADEPVEYRYMLEGQDKDWIAAGERNFVSFNLPPGQYVFKAQARYGKSPEWSIQPAIVQFVIATPFWKTGWFISLLILVSTLLAYGLYRYRLFQALKLERLRSRISTDLHDDIGSTLSSISILSEMASQEKDWSQSREMITEIKQNSVSLMEKMDDIVWSINPRNDSIGELMLRIKRFAARLFEARDIDYSIHIDEDIHTAKLDMESRQHIYLIMKEAINNLVKYSGCTKASINVHYRYHQLEIEIRDNGKGFNEQNIQLGNGIISMRKRAEAMRAAISIRSIKEEGTVVSLQTKIK